MFPIVYNLTRLMDAVSLPIVAVVLVVLGAIVALVGVRSIANGKRRDAEIRHQQFADSMDLTHRERLAQIASDRDQALAKMGVKVSAGGMLQLEQKAVSDGASTRTSGAVDQD